MAATSAKKTIVIGLVLGVTLGALIGLIGAYFEWSMAVRGAVMGAMIVLGFTLMQRLTKGR